MRNRLKSFGYAFAGLGRVLKSEPNARIHLLASVVVVALGWALGLTAGEWLWIGGAIAFVWVAETFNSAFEYLCDLVSPGHSEAVKNAKDIAAGAVLLAAIFAVFVGVVVFGPKLAGLFV